MQGPNFGRAFIVICRLMCVLVWLVLAAPVVLGGEPGKANDLTGVWTQTISNGNLWLATFHADGTALVDQQGNVVFDPVQSAQQGLWKKVSARTFISSLLLLEYNKDASLYGTVKVQTLYTLYPSGDQYDCNIVATETLANGQVNVFGPFQAHGVRLTLEPPPL